MKCFVIFIIVLFLFASNGCNERLMRFENEKMESAIAAYIEYLDSTGYDKKNDYIVVEALIKQDSTFISIYLWGGSYVFLCMKDKFIDFFPYNNHDIIFLGDFPNIIVNSGKNHDIDIINDIVKIKFNDDYQKYLENPHAIGPLIYDNMELEMVFKKEKLINKRNKFH